MIYDLFRACPSAATEAPQSLALKGLFRGRFLPVGLSLFVTDPKRRPITWESLGLLDEISDKEVFFIWMIFPGKLAVASSVHGQCFQNPCTCQLNKISQHALAERKLLHHSENHGHYQLHHITMFRLSRTPIEWTLDSEHFAANRWASKCDHKQLDSRSKKPNWACSLN